MKAIETTAKVENAHHLMVDDVLPIPSDAKVRLIVLFNEEEEEILESLWLKAASTNPVFDELNDPAEDIYSIKDGKPFHG